MTQHKNWRKKDANMASFYQKKVDRKHESYHNCKDAVHNMKNRNLLEKLYMQQNTTQKNDIAIKA